MTVYTISPFPARVIWPDPIEPIWQGLPTYSPISPQWKRADIELSDRLFIGAVVNAPKEQRTWGIMNWLADTFQVSRPTLYAIGERTKSGVLLAPNQASAAVPAAPTSGKKGKRIAVTPNRVKRTALSLVLPGGVAERSIRDCLYSAFDEGRCAGYVSALIHEAGQHAGKILAQVDHAVLGTVVQARDELFVGREPILLMVEPKSLMITGLYATTDRDAETWGCVLLFSQDRGVQIRGLAEDNCIPYAASCKLIRLDAAIQKDVWHPLEDVRKVIQDIEREALRKLEAADKLEKRLRKQWNEADFAELLQISAPMDDLLAQSERLRFLRGCLWDAVELVDWRSGEIRDRPLNQWLMDEILKEMKQLHHPRIQKLLERLEEVFPEILTFLDGVAEPLSNWQAQAEEHFKNPQSVAYFQSRVAQLWRLEHALRNGQKHFSKVTQEAEQWLADWVIDDPELHPLAEKLLSLLENVVRTSSAAETVNSVLRPFLERRRECTDLVSRQLFLNLFVLWFNLHKFERGPRKGKSPYELAGIDLGTDDWLTLLGYPPD